MAERPAHLNPDWRYLALTEDRTPLRGRTRAGDPEYWEGSPITWDEALEYTATGNALGVLTQASNLVVLDCDVRGSWEEENGKARQTWRYGIDDLVKAAADLGHQVEPTLTVRSRSGGLHLYYLQNRDFPVRSKAHREGWLIDVKASPHTFAVVPPTSGYEVVRDLPVAVMPEWLARFIHGLSRNLPPLGGQEARRMMLEIRGLRQAQMAGSLVTDPGSLQARWLELSLGLVRMASRAGGWNNHIYITAHQFFEVGISVEETERLLLDAAEPWNQTEAYVVSRTVRSAWDKHLREGDSDRYWSYRDKV